MDITEVAKLIPKENLSLVFGVAIVVAIISLVLYAIRVLYPILKKKSYDEITCLAHSSISSELNTSKENLFEYEKRLHIMEQSVAAIEEHRKRTDFRLDKLEISVKELTGTVLPMVSKITSIESTTARIEDKLDTLIMGQRK